jgi:hypothetical protein
VRELREGSEAFEKVIPDVRMVPQGQEKLRLAGINRD